MRTEPSVESTHNPAEDDPQENGRNAGRSTASRQSRREPPGGRRRLAGWSARLLLVIVVLLIAGGLGGNSAPSPQPELEDEPFMAYSEDSFFRKPLPDKVPIDAESDVGIAYLEHAPQQNLHYPAIRGLQGEVGGDWGMPFFVADNRDPVWKLTGNVNKKVAFLATDGFHAPDKLGDILTGTSDSPIVVADTTGGFTLWAHRAKQTGPRTIEVSLAGAFFHSSNGLDHRNPLSDDQRNFRGRGAIPDAMVIRKDLVEHGIEHGTGLGHVLHYFALANSTEGHVHPMTGNETPRDGWGPQGIRIRTVRTWT